MSRFGSRAPATRASDSFELSGSLDFSGGDLSIDFSDELPKSKPPRPSAGPARAPPKPAGAGRTSLGARGATGPPSKAPARKSEDSFSISGSLSIDFSDEDIGGAPTTSSARAVLPQSRTPVFGTASGGGGSRGGGGGGGYQAGGAKGGLGQKKAAPPAPKDSDDFDMSIEFSDDGSEESQPKKPSYGQPGLAGRGQPGLARGNAGPSYGSKPPSGAGPSYGSKPQVSQAKNASSDLDSMEIDFSDDSDAGKPTSHTTGSGAAGGGSRPTGGGLGRTAGSGAASMQYPKQQQQPLQGSMDSELISFSGSLDELSDKREADSYDIEWSGSDDPGGVMESIDIRGSKAFSGGGQSLFKSADKKKASTAHEVYTARSSGSTPTLSGSDFDLSGDISMASSDSSKPRQGRAMRSSTHSARSGHMHRSASSDGSKGSGGSSSSSSGGPQMKLRTLDELEAASVAASDYMSGSIKMSSDDGRPNLMGMGDLELASSSSQAASEYKPHIMGMDDLDVASDLSEGYGGEQQYGGGDTPSISFSDVSDVGLSQSLRVGEGRRRSARITSTSMMDDLDDDLFKDLATKPSAPRRPSQTGTRLTGGGDSDVDLAELAPPVASKAGRAPKPPKKRAGSTPSISGSSFASSSGSSGSSERPRVMNMDQLQGPASHSQSRSHSGGSSSGSDSRPNLMTMDALQSDSFALSGSIEISQPSSSDGGRPQLLGMDDLEAVSEQGGSSDSRRMVMGMDQLEIASSATPSISGSSSSASRPRVMNKDRLGPTGLAYVSLKARSSTGSSASRPKIMGMDELESVSYGGSSRSTDSRRQLMGMDDLDAASTTGSSSGRGRPIAMGIAELDTGASPTPSFRDSGSSASSGPRPELMGLGQLEKVAEASSSSSSAGRPAYMGMDQLEAASSVGSRGSGNSSDGWPQLMGLEHLQAVSQASSDDEPRNQMMDMADLQVMSEGGSSGDNLAGLTMVGTRGGSSSSSSSEGKQDKGGGARAWQNRLTPIQVAADSGDTPSEGPSPSQRLGPGGSMSQSGLSGDIMIAPTWRAADPNESTDHHYYPSNISSPARVIRPDLSQSIAMDSPRVGRQDSVTEEILPLFRSSTQKIGGRDSPHTMAPSPSFRPIHSQALAAGGVAMMHHLSDGPRGPGSPVTSRLMVPPATFGRRPVTLQEQETQAGVESAEQQVQAGVDVASSLMQTDPVEHILDLNPKPNRGDVKLRTVAIQVGSMNEVSTQVAFDLNSERLTEGSTTLTNADLELARLRPTPTSYTMATSLAPGHSPAQHHLMGGHPRPNTAPNFGVNQAAAAFAPPSSFGILSMAFQNMRAAGIIEQLEQNAHHMQSASALAALSAASAFLPQGMSPAPAHGMVPAPNRATPDYNHSHSSSMGGPFGQHPMAGTGTSPSPLATSLAGGASGSKDIGRRHSLASGGGSGGHAYASGDSEGGGPTIGQRMSTNTYGVPTLNTAPPLPKGGQYNNLSSQNYSRYSTSRVEKVEEDTEVEDDTEESGRGAVSSDIVEEESIADELPLGGGSGSEEYDEDFESVEDEFAIRPGHGSTIKYPARPSVNVDNSDDIQTDIGEETYSEDFSSMQGTPKKTGGYTNTYSDTFTTIGGTTPVASSAMKRTSFAVTTPHNTTSSGGSKPGEIRQLHKSASHLGNSNLEQALHPGEVQQMNRRVSMGGQKGLVHIPSNNTMTSLSKPGVTKPSTYGPARTSITPEARTSITPTPTSAESMRVQGQPYWQRPADSQTTTPEKASSHRPQQQQQQQETLSYQAQGGASPLSNQLTLAQETLMRYQMLMASGAMGFGGFNAFTPPGFSMGPPGLASALHSTLPYPPLQGQDTTHPPNTMNPGMGPNTGVPQPQYNNYLSMNHGVSQGVATVAQPQLATVPPNTMNPGLRPYTGVPQPQYKKYLSMSEGMAQGAGVPISVGQQLPGSIGAGYPVPGAGAGGGSGTYSGGLAEVRGELLKSAIAGSCNIGFSDLVAEQSTDIQSKLHLQRLHARLALTLGRGPLGSTLGGGSTLDLRSSTAAPPNKDRVVVLDKSRGGRVKLHDVSSASAGGYQYTTLEDTLHYIRSHRPLRL